MNVCPTNVKILVATKLHYILLYKIILIDHHKSSASMQCPANNICNLGYTTEWYVQRLTIIVYDSHTANRRVQYYLCRVFSTGECDWKAFISFADEIIDDCNSSAQCLILVRWIKYYLRTYWCVVLVNCGDKKWKQLWTWSLLVYDDNNDNNKTIIILMMEKLGSLVGQ